MKDLQLSDLENISGGNGWDTAGNICCTVRKYAFYVVISVGCLLLGYLVRDMSPRSSAETDTCNTTQPL